MSLKVISIYPIFLLSIFLSLSSHPAPSWVEGIRSGSESLRVVVGDKIFFRRIAGSEGMSKTEACDQVVNKAQEDIKNEFYLYEDIPHRVEVLFYDEKNSDCAVTVSVPQNIPDKYLKLNQWKKDQKEKENELNSKIKEAEEEKKRLELKQRQLESYIQKNAYIINQVNKLEQTAESVEGMIRNRQDKAERFAITGLRKREFEKMTGDIADISLTNPSRCYNAFQTFRASIHGGIDICWGGSDIILGYCIRSKGLCYTKSP